MIFETKSIDAGVEKLSTLRVALHENTPITLLMLHGAGRSNKRLSLPLAVLLAKRNTGSLSLDFSGYGQSTHHGVQSLSKRVSEAKQLIRHFQEPIDTICAFSMSCYIALHLLRSIHVRNLIFFAPALYDKNAFDVPFGISFTRIIQKKQSWLKSDGKSLLRDFHGRIQIFFGENDDVVPYSVIELYMLYASHAQKKQVVRLPNVGHRIARAMNKDKKLRTYICNKIYAFIE